MSFCELIISSLLKPNYSDEASFDNIACQTHEGGKSGLRALISTPTGFLILHVLSFDTFHDYNDTVYDILTEIKLTLAYIEYLYLTPDFNCKIILNPHNNENFQSKRIAYMRAN